MAKAKAVPSPKKPKRRRAAKPAPESRQSADKLEVRTDGKGKIWSHVRSKWLVETPEELVRITQAEGILTTEED